MRSISPWLLPRCPSLAFEPAPRRESLVHPRSLFSIIFALLVALSGASAQGQTVCLQPPSGSVAWWSFDETSGNIAADRLGISPGEWVNNPVPAPGEVRGALSFNGTNYVSAQDSPLWDIGANDFTTELWANFDTVPGGSIVEPGAIFIGNDDGPGLVNKWFFGLGGGVLDFTVYNTAQPPPNYYLVRAPFLPVVGQWYHLAVTKHGTLYTIYVNGIAVGSEISTPPIGKAVAPLTIGQAEGIGFMQGRLDEATVYNRALAPEEVQAIYSAGSSGKCISLQISPNTGGDTGNVSVNVNGTGFQQGATVSLAMTGQPSIAGNPVTVGANGTNIATTFNLTGQTDGAWDVVVANPDGTSQTLLQGFTVQAGTQPQIWVDIVGIGLIEPGRAQAFQIFYGNTGNVDAVGVPLWIAGIPPNATLSLGFSALPPLPVGNPPVDYSQVPTFANTGTDLEAGFLMSVIPAGSTGALQISITVPEMENFQLQAWTNPPWFGSSQSTSSLQSLSPRSISRRSRSASWQSRLDGRSELAFSTADLLNCGLAVLNDIYGAANQNLGDCEKSALGAYQEFLVGLGTREPANLAWAITNVAFQCGLAAACDLCVEGHLTASCVVCVATNIEGVLNELYDAYNTGKDCANSGLQIGEVLAQIIAIASFDPNNKVGSPGIGTAQFVPAQQPLRYSISFQNLPSATAPAQQVVVTDQLDATKVDLTTLSLGPIAFGSNQVIPPAASSTLAASVDLRPATDLIVQVTGSLNPNNGLLTWQFTSIDPATGDPPTDPAFGFLPPDVTPPQGEGSVLFTVMPKQGDVLGTQITNQATIVFDANAPISTPTWLNTIGVTPPVTVTPSGSSISTAQALTVTIAVTGTSGNPTPTGTVTLSSGSYASTATMLSSGRATINIPAGSLAVGTDTLTVSYSGDGNYIPASGANSVTVTALPFTVAGTTVSVAPGATTGNTSTITLTPGAGFTGSVTLTAAITTSPVGAVDPPTLSFGSTSPVSITSAAAATATLTISTTAATRGALTYPARPGSHWYSAGGTGLAFVLLFGIGIPARGRSWRTRLGLFVVLMTVAVGFLACGGGSGGGSGSSSGPAGNPGTTPGTYTVTVTGTSSGTTATGTVTLTVQ